ncbi:ERCC1 nucleotide excision repair protein, putative [Hepatocystis sp. ex Piliocolobus tephrosceles]|nr:ERCC1 nucleotide excision repair protein, putative [Hepatocystis sp. ex Piliocolobus tephrosceles]
MNENTEELNNDKNQNINSETTKEEIFYDFDADKYLIISIRQKSNPVVKKINRVRYKFNSIIPDFLIGSNIACLFISMKYHRLRPNYLESRIKTLSNKYNNRILLCLVDIENIENTLGEINQIAFCFNMTLILCWNIDECAKIIEDFKIHEKTAFYSKKNIPFSNNKEKIHELLKKIRCINSSDCFTITKKFKSFSNIVNAKKSDLINCSGLGNKKIQVLLSTFNDPFF